MWIKTLNNAVSKLKIAEIDEPVDFNNNGTAQVPSDVGETLIEKVDSIERRNKKDDKDKAGGSSGVDRQSPSGDGETDGSSQNQDEESEEE